MSAEVTELVTASGSAAERAVALGPRKEEALATVWAGLSEATWEAASAVVSVQALAHCLEQGSAKHLA